MWERSRERQNWVEEKLDRSLANSRWFDLFPSGRVYNEYNFSSDHSTLILELGRQKPTGY